MAKNEKFQYTKEPLYREGAKSARFRTFYRNGKIISKAVKAMNFSYNKYHELGERLRKQHITRDAYATSIYEKFNIRQYKDMEELTRDMITYGRNKEQIAEIIKDYKHRDELIRSGQYEEYRLSSYKQRYIRALKIANIDESIIKNIEKLDLSKFGELMGLRDARTTTMGKYRLPQLGGFNYYSIGINYNDKTKEIEEEIRGAFNEANIPFNENIIANPIKFKPMETQYTLRNTLERLFPSQVEYLNSATTEKEYKQRAFKLLEEKVLAGKKIYKEKNGIATLSFIGKSIPTSKNFTFVYDFKKYINRK